MRRINRIQSYAILICAIQLLSSVTYEYVLNKSSKVHISSAFESLRTGEIRYKQNENKQAGLYETIVVSALDSCYRAKWGQDPVSNWPQPSPPFHICGSKCQHLRTLDLRFEQIFPSAGVSACLLLSALSWYAIVNMPQMRKYQSDFTEQLFGIIFACFTTGLLTQPFGRCLDVFW